MTANSDSRREKTSPRDVLTALRIDPWYGLLDVALVVTGILLAFTNSKILFFHAIFILLTVGAFFWRLGPFAIRAVIWVTLGSMVVLNAILAGKTPAEEFMDVPLLTIILLVVFGVARQRTKAEEALRKTNDELESRVAERTGELTQVNVELVDEIAQHKQTAAMLRESEERYRRLVELSFDAVFIHNWEKLIYINRAGARLLGASDPQELVGKPMRDLVHPDYWDLVQARAQQATEVGKDAPLVEEKLLRLDGTPVEIEAVSISITYQGQPALQTVIRDITARRQAEAERELERTRIARDLHDSLGHSLGYLHLKLDQLASGDVMEDMTGLRRELGHMRDVSNEAYELVRGMLAALLPSASADVLTMMRAQAQMIGARGGFDVCVSSEGRPQDLDPVLQQQVLYLFQEALINVERHASAQQVHIKMLWAEDCLTIVLADDGCGFELDGLQTQEHYGLRVMRERATEMNAQLRLSARPGVGTEILLHLPLVANVRRRTKR